MVDALAVEADEGRGRRRYRSGSCQQVTIRSIPNVATHLDESRGTPM
jgi:hypothetical protein